MRHFLLLSAAALIPVQASAQNNQQQQNAAGVAAYAQFSEGRLEHDVFKDGKKGMEVHHKIRAVGMNGKELEVACYFYKSDGTALRDTNQAFRTTTGEVSVGERHQVQYEDATFNDFSLFIPHDEMHAGAGAHDLKTNCEAFDSGRSLGKSGFLTFTLRVGGAVPKVAKFGAGSLKHDVWKDNVKGLEIHHPLTVQAMKDRELEVTCFFYYEAGGGLRDTNKLYYSADGNVSVMDKVNVQYVDATFNDFTHFIPYDELHLPAGKTDLKIQCEAFDQGVSIGKSEWLHLWYNKN